MLQKRKEKMQVKSKLQPMFEVGDQVEIDAYGYRDIKAGSKGKILQLVWEGCPGETDEEDSCPIYKVQFGPGKLAAHRRNIPEFALNKTL